MSTRKLALVIAFAAAGMSAAMAAGTGTFVQGEIGYTDGPVQSTRSRQSVTDEFLVFRRNPVTADGARYVGGELGYAYPPHTHVFVDGKWVATGGIGHNPKPAAVMGVSERRLFTERYPAR